MKKWLIVILVVAGCAAYVVWRLWPVEGPPLDKSDKLRIVSVAPSVTEILFALGVGDQVVGVTNACDWPPETRNIEIVGGFGTPNIETVLSLRPDALIATDFEREDMPDLLCASGIRVIDIRIDSFETLFHSIRVIGETVGRTERAGALIAELQTDLDVAAARSAHVPRAQRPRVFVEIWHEPLCTAGGGSFLSEVIECAGGINVARELKTPYPYVTPEQAIAWDPDVILVAYMTNANQVQAQLEGRLGWRQVKAVREGQIVSDIPLDLILRPGPRLVEGVKMLAERLYPDAAPSKSPTGSAPSKDTAR